MVSLCDCALPRWGRGQGNMQRVGLCARLSPGQGGWLLSPPGGEMSGSFAPCLDRSAGCGVGAGQVCLL